MRIEEIERKLDALIVQQKTMKTLVCRVHIQGQALADKLAALRAENERLQTALRPFAEYRGRPFQEKSPDYAALLVVNTPDGLTHQITWGDLRLARTALKEG